MNDMREMFFSSSQKDLFHFYHSTNCTERRLRKGNTMTNSRSDTRSVDGERVRFRASAKPECHPVPKAEQRRESKRKKEGDGGRGREKGIECQSRVRPNTRCSSGPSIVTWQHTAVNVSQWRTDVREGSLAREMRLREGKGKGRERAEVRDFESGPTEPAMRLVIHYGHPGAR